MAARVHFEIDPTFELSVLTRNPELESALMNLAARVEITARTLAPYRLGRLSRSIKRTTGVAVVNGLPRLIGRVLATSYLAPWHEFGTRRMQPHPFLGPALADVLPGAELGPTGGGDE